MTNLKCESAAMIIFLDKTIPNIVEAMILHQIAEFDFEIWNVSVIVAYFVG
ncbi:MAG: hypothetical protein ACE5DO_04165 [Desulfobacterales bacterium]